TVAGAVAITRGAVKMTSWAKPVQDVMIVVSMMPAPDGSSEVEVSDLAAKYDETQLTGSAKVKLKYLDFDKLLDNEWDVSLQAKGPRLAFLGGNVARDVSMKVKFRSEGPGKARLTFADTRAKLGLGKAVLEGGVGITTLDLRSLAKNDYDIKLLLDRAGVRYANSLKGSLSGHLVAKNPTPGAPAEVKGELTLAHGVLGFQPSMQQAKPELKAAPKDTPDFHFDIKAGIAEDVRIEGAGMKMPLQPDYQALRLTGTPQDPRLRGRITAQQGRASLPGGFLAIKSFSVSVALAPRVGIFSPPKPLDLLVKVQGQAERVVSQVEMDGRVVGPVHLYLNFSGELPGEIQVKATSEPPLAEEQIYAILGAEPFGGLMAAGEAGSEALSRRFASLLAVGLRAGVFEPLEAQLRQLLGLAEFSINFALDQPIEVRLGKYLVRNLLVSYRQSLGAGADNEWWVTVSYEVAPGTVVSYYARDDGEERFSVGLRRLF
ncbi:MAG: translocation/assembly module TamB domain-containing protein, partial [Armatimonadetes bacterium]|nr:translocation/assembly module TamB domain-containing protein [Armatimonadota bacterium]